MAVHIRLSRGGTKKVPYYNIVVADSRMPRDGRYIEKVGTYNPMLEQTDENRVKIDLERAKHWLSVGAQPSDRVKLFLAKMGLVAKPAIPNLTKKNQPKAKALERMKAAEEKAAAAIEAKKAAEAAASTSSEPAKEEAPVQAEETSAPAEVSAEAPAEVAAEAPANE